MSSQYDPTVYIIRSIEDLVAFVNLFPGDLIVTSPCTLETLPIKVSKDALLDSFTFLKEVAVGEVVARVMIIGTGRQGHFMSPFLRLPIYGNIVDFIPHETNLKVDA